MMKKKNAFIFTMLLLWSAVNLQAQNEKFKALFLYNFIKNVEWPAAYHQGDIVIGVYGNTTMAKELENITSTQKAGSQAMKVKLITNPDEASDCHLIYVSSSKTGSIPQLMAKVGGSNILVVSDGKGGIQSGSAINFIVDGDKLKFEISKQHIEQKGLKVSASLLNLGIQIN